MRRHGAETGTDQFSTIGKKSMEACEPRDLTKVDSEERSMKLKDLPRNMKADS